MNRHDFQQLAELRLRDAEVLLVARGFDAAFYLLGYVVEGALKACIAKQTKEFDFPPRDAAAVYTHNLKNLKCFNFGRRTYRTETNKRRISFRR